MTISGWGAGEMGENRAIWKNQTFFGSVVCKVL